MTAPALSQSDLAAELAGLDPAVVSVSVSTEPAPDVCEHDSDHGPSLVFVRVENRPFDLCVDCGRRLVAEAVVSGCPMVVVQVFAWPSPAGLAVSDRADRWAIAPLVAVLGMVS